MSPEKIAEGRRLLERAVGPPRDTASGSARSGGMRIQVKCRSKKSQHSPQRITYVLCEDGVEQEFLLHESSFSPEGHLFAYQGEVQDNSVQVIFPDESSSGRSWAWVPRGDVLEVLVHADALLDAAELAAQIRADVSRAVCAEAERDALRAEVERLRAAHQGLPHDA